MTRLILYLTFFSILASAAENATTEASMPIAVPDSLRSASVESRPEISFPPKVEVSPRENVRLGDLVIVSRPTNELLAILDGLSLKMKPTISAAEVTALFRSEMEANENFAQINPAYKIPNEIQIQTSVAPISKAEVERRILNTLQSQCHECEYRINVQSAPFPAQKTWELDLSQISTKGSFLVPVRDGDQRALKWISGSVRVSKLTPVATKFISSQERIQDGDLKLAMVDITFAKDSGLRIKDIQGQLLTRSVQIGQPVWASDIKREPATKRGQIVRATLGNSEFEISTNLEAQDSGFIGDLIKVKSLETQKMLSALITDKGVVQIQ